MPMVQADRLTRIGAALLGAAGATEQEASTVATGCVNANLAGHDSHGIIAIPTYIDRIKLGHIVPGAPWTIVQKSPTTTVIDGHWGFGFRVNAKAMVLTIEKAKTANVAAFRPLQDFKKEVAEFARYLKATPPSEGSSGVFYPGEVEFIREQQRRLSGIEVEDTTWDKLRALAGEYKLAAELDLA
jgi:LDH2 family malate/lactate/ureidoglycolate dehydrogenase